MGDVSGLVATKDVLDNVVDAGIEGERVERFGHRKVVPQDRRRRHSTVWTNNVRIQIRQRLVSISSCRRIVLCRQLFSF